MEKCKKYNDKIFTLADLGVTIDIDNPCFELLNEVIGGGDEIIDSLNGVMYEGESKEEFLETCYIHAKLKYKS